MANATRVAKPRKKKKTVGAWLQEAKMPAPIAAAGAWLDKKMFPPPSDTPGEINYPAIAKAREAAAKRRKMLKEMGL
jgi:hypothetical protein